MSYSIVIPTLNEERIIGALLDKLVSQTQPAEQIIVVDGGSTDKTLRVIRKFPVTLLESQANVGLQRNTGGNRVTSNVIIFLDADTYPDNDFCQKLISSFTQRKLDLACPQFKPDIHKGLVPMLFSLLNLLFALSGGHIASGAGPCIIVKTKVFQSSPGFSTTKKFEDIRLIRHLAQKHRYGTLPVLLTVSARRFTQCGVVRTVVNYLILGVLFTFNQFDLAEIIHYPYRNETTKN